MRVHVHFVKLLSVSDVQGHATVRRATPKLPRVIWVGPNEGGGGLGVYPWVRGGNHAEAAECRQG